MNQRRTTQAGRHPRRGFTLVEMLLVIGIIALLAAMLLPAIQSAQTTARNAAVRSEISGLEAAIANFKATYGVEPPSRITLYETPADWTYMAPMSPTAAQTQKQLDASQSLSVIRRMWPNVDVAQISQNWNADDAAGTTNPDTANATAGKIVLNGAESLVFFLGGVMANGAPQGFSKNPSSPFAPPQTGEVRQGPFFEFQSNRLKASPYQTATNGNALTFRVYFDSLPGQTNPYGYLNSNEGRGYQPLPGEFVYLISANNPHKPKSFQIISPGADGQYGSGGIFDPSQANSALADIRDRDNITNLASGRLAP